MYNKKLHYHFVGIGGSGMSGIAEILVNHGFKVSGSDLKINSSCERLKKLGAEIYQGHHASNLTESVNLLVYSSAVNAENPEVKEATERKIPVIRRAEVLAELMRLSYGVGVAGSHGKTSTTSMIAAILEHAGLDPTVIIGGQVKSLGSGAKLGKSDFLVAETDESDRSFLLLKPTMAVVTNIDTEHLNAYKSFAELQKSFHDYLTALPFYGFAALCIDDQKVRDLAAEYKGRLMSYGLSPDAELTAKNISHKRMHSNYEVWRSGNKIMDVCLPIPGLHMVVNSLAAIAIGLELDILPEKISYALNNFSGVKRRLEVIGEAAGVTVMNDYGHHPTEIKATLNAIRTGFAGEIGKLHVVFQPHRYSRTKDCFADFIDAFRDCDRLYMTEIYAASEEPISGISGKILLEAVSHQSKVHINSPEDSVKLLLSDLKAGDMVLCLGAGTVGNLPELLLAGLESRKAA